MLNCKMNQRFKPEYDKNFWKCDACQNLDMQSHLMCCPAYATLREGLDIDCNKDVFPIFPESLQNS